MSDADTLNEELKTGLSRSTYINESRENATTALIRHLEDVNAIRNEQEFEEIRERVNQLEARIDEIVGNETEVMSLEDLYEIYDQFIDLVLEKKENLDKDLSIVIVESTEKNKDGITTGQIYAVIPENINDESKTQLFNLLTKITMEFVKQSDHLVMPLEYLEYKSIKDNIDNEFLTEISINELIQRSV